MIEIQNLNFSYGSRPVLENLSFSAPAGSLTAVLGPNGVGKSTLFRCILGFLAGYSGSITLNGKNIRELSRREMARQAAYIPQSADPVFNYTVMDTVLMGTTGTLDPYRSPGKEQKEIAEQMLRELDIWELRDRGISRISGGERQLALIARAMAQQAKLLIMDEPTANLDYGNQYRVLDRVRRLTERGYAVLLSTHNPDHALHFATHVLTLQRGGVYHTGPAAEVLTADLLGDIYRIPVALTETEIEGNKVRSCIPVL